MNIVKNKLIIDLIEHNTLKEVKNIIKIFYLKINILLMTKIIIQIHSSLESENENNHNNGSSEDDVKDNNNKDDR